MTAVSRHALLALLLAAPFPASPALAGPALASHEPPIIETLAKPVRSRILTGTSSEGTSVEATAQGGQYARIVAEALNETGRTISDFRFDHGRLASARIIRIGYKGYPDVSLATAPPHQHLVIDPTDVVISDLRYDFTSGKSACTTPDCSTSRQEARTEAALYVRLMNTPSPGLAEDEGDWACTPPGDPACPAFKREYAP